MVSQLSFIKASVLFIAYSFLSFWTFAIPKTVPKNREIAESVVKIASIGKPQLQALSSVEMRTPIAGITIQIAQRKIS